MNSAGVVPGGVVRAPLFPLAIGQLVSWGTLYYGITFLAGAAHEETGWRLSDVFSAFSSGLLAAAFAAAPAARLFNRYAGCSVMGLGSVMAALGLVIMSSSETLRDFYLAWILTGLAMSLTLYEAAFSTLRDYAGLNFRRAVSVITVVGGFAGTVFWPLTDWLVTEAGWRATVMIFAGTHLCIGFIFVRMPNPRKPRVRQESMGAVAGVARQSVHRLTTIMAAAFALAALVTSAISAHAAILLDQMGAAPWLSLLAMSLIGPVQVTARVLDGTLSNRLHSITLGKLAFASVVLGTLFLGCVATIPWSVFAFAVFYGMGNGLLTLVRGSLPAELMGHADYATALGLISTPTLVARALGPHMAAVSIDVWGYVPTLFLLIGFAVSATLVFWCMVRASGGRES